MNRDNGAELAVDRFFTRFAERQTEPVGEHDTADALKLADESTPRGLVQSGLVRTTGWLQFGTRPISSGLIAAVIGLLIAIVIVVTLFTTMPAVSGLIPLLPAVCYGSWHVLTTRLLPASTARNVETVTAEELRAGGWVRLHGSIGPVGHVASTAMPADAVIEVTFVGGISQHWPRQHRLHVVELLD